MFATLCPGNELFHRHSFGSSKRGAKHNQRVNRFVWRLSGAFGVLQSYQQISGHGGSL